MLNTNILSITFIGDTMVLILKCKNKIQRRIKKIL